MACLLSGRDWAVTTPWSIAHRSFDRTRVLLLLIADVGIIMGPLPHYYHS
jgi:hypothetical protein